MRAHFLRTAAVNRDQSKFDANSIKWIVFKQELITFIEYVRGGHVGGENKNIFAWELNFFPKENSFIVLLLQHGRRAHTLLAYRMLTLQA